MSDRSNWVVHRRDGRVVLDLNPAVFGASTLLIALFVAVGLFYRRDFAATADAVQAWIANRAGWFLVLTVNVVLVYLIFLLLSRFGAIRIGGPDARPEFTRSAWIAMLFSAGMGIGLLFYAVAEPVYHLASVPLGADPGSPQAYRDAMKVTFLHWGLHAWGVYALTGLALAYAAFNRHRPLSVRSLFASLLGERIHGWLGHTIDVVATVATLFGVATSLGLGAIQVNAGISYLFDVPANSTVQVALIVGITILATLSVVLGLDKGIKRLSVINMLVAALLLAFVFFVGPTLFLLNGFVQDIGGYLGNLIELGLWNETYTRGDWQNGWTVFYWGWWIAWSPFVGLFLARISRGRTIREFIGTTLVVSAAMTLAWLAVFGNSAMFIELAGPGGLVEAVQSSLERSLFVFLDLLPAATGAPVSEPVLAIVGVLAIAAIVLFFVTSSDSGSLVIDIITAGGRVDAPVAQRIYWATAEGVVAAVLLVGGGLVALQTAAISAGLPFAVVLLLLIVSLHRDLAADGATRKA